MIYFYKNLSFLREKNNKTQNEVAVALGFKQRSRYSNYEQGSSAPDFDILLRISNYYNIMIDPLLKVDLSKTKNLSIYEIDQNQRNMSGLTIGVDGKLNSIDKKDPIGKILELSTEKTLNKNIPLIPTGAVAGMNTNSIQIMDYEIEHYFTLPLIKETADYIWQINGDSMTPTYENGGYIACKVITLEEFKWEKPYLIVVNHAPMIKRLLPSVNKDCLLCRSDNNKIHRDFEIQKTDINSIAKILAYIYLE